MSTPLPTNHASFDLGEIAHETSGAIAYGAASLRTSSVSTDTRSLDPGALFVALRGDRFDGHDHLAVARAQGAVAAVVEREVSAPEGLAVVRVSSTLQALGALARAHARKWRALGGRRILGITGSAGKTTTRIVTAAIARALAGDAVLSSSGNLNNLVGVPHVLFGLTPTHRVAVVEMGTNRPGEIAALAAIAEPVAGMITAIAVAHAEGLGGIEGVAREKSALLAALPENGVAFGPTGDFGSAHIDSAIAASPAMSRIRYGLEEASGAAYRVVRRELAPSGEVSLQIACSDPNARRPRRMLAARARLVGRAGALACAAAVAAVERGLELGEVSESALQSGVEAAARELEGRLVLRPLGGGIVVLDDSYNANPASMRSSIDAAAELASASERRLVLVLGEMRELGAHAEAEHAEIGTVAASIGRLPARSAAALIVAVGNAARPIAEAAQRLGVKALHCPDSDSAGAIMSEVVAPGDIILVKGSRGVRTERVIEALERHHGQGPASSARAVRAHGAP